jgi:hypothetical protein
MFFAGVLGYHSLHLPEISVRVFPNFIIPANLLSSFS